MPYEGEVTRALLGDLQVSANRRFLVSADGTPFFYLGCTAWELFHRLTKEEAEFYLEDRRTKGFTVIQAVVLAEYDGLNVSNAYGDVPFHTTDASQPNEAYFCHVDWIVETAEQKGLYIGMLPTWGDKVGPAAWGIGPEGFINRGNARSYGLYLGKRYADSPNIIWILGGDRNPPGFLEVWRELATGLREGDGGRHLCTYHPSGGRSSAEWLIGEPWLDFHMGQSGHGELNLPNYQMITHAYQADRTRPCMDGEPRYEDHPIGFKPENGWFDAFDVRQAAYWAVFAGACGHTYGCHDIWQFYAPERQPVTFARTYWRDALHLPGAGQMQYLRRLVESRPFLSRIPDQALITAGQTEGMDHLQATRGDGYAFIYAPTGKSCTVRLEAVGGSELIAWWYNPRTGAAQCIGRLATQGEHQFVPPSSGRGHDWVLVLDDAAREFGPPGVTQ